MNPVADAKSELKSWAALAHLAFMFTFVGIPFAGVLGATGIYLAKRSGGPFVEGHAKAALNYQLTQTLALAILAAICGSGFMVSSLSLGPYAATLPAIVGTLVGMIACATLILLTVIVLVESLLNANRASQGEMPNYRAYTYNFIK